MRRAILLFNPAAGRAAHFTAALPELTRLLAAQNLQAEIIHTEATHDSANARLRASAQDAAFVIACGGDGTVHTAVQALGHSGIPLGVLPLGTANALARNLSLPLDPVAALTQLLRFRSVDVPLGEVTTAHGSRHFLVMAGCGPDGALALSASNKGSGGRTAYYTRAARLFFTRRFPAFRVDFRPIDSSAWRTTEAVALMAARVPDLGGPFSRLTPRASLLHPHLHVHLLRAPAHLSLPAWLLASRTPFTSPLAVTLDVEELRCSPLSAASAEVHAQADAEPLGPLPIAMRIVPAGLRLLMP